MYALGAAQSKSVAGTGIEQLTFSSSLLAVPDTPSLSLRLIHKRVGRTMLPWKTKESYSILIPNYKGVAQTQNKPFPCI